MDISVDSGGNNDHTSGYFLLEQVLAQEHSVSHASSGTNEDQTSQSQSLASGHRLGKLLLCTERIGSSANVIVASQVAEVLVSFFFQLDELLVVKAVNTVDESNQLGARSLSLVSKETINDVLATWSLLAHEDETDFLNRVSALIRELFSVELIDAFVVNAEFLVCQEHVVNLEEVVG